MQKPIGGRSIMALSPVISMLKKPETNPQNKGKRHLKIDSKHKGV